MTEEEKSTTQVILEVAKEEQDADADRTEDGKRIFTLSTGVRITMNPVNPAVITEILARIQPPEIPEVWIETKGRKEKNPLDPGYLAKMELWAGERANAIMEAFVLTGVELLDGLPEDTTWLRRLQMLERHGRLDLSIYDLDDDFDLAFLYAKNVAMGPRDWEGVFSAFNVTPSGVRTAEDTFQS